MDNIFASKKDLIIEIRGCSLLNNLSPKEIDKLELKHLTMSKLSENFKQMNLDAAMQLGKLLLEAREISAEDVDEIARNLALTRSQIFGVELVDFSGFLSYTYYILAAKKYANYLKVDFDFDSLLKNDEIPPVIREETHIEKEQNSKTAAAVLMGKLLNKKYVMYTLVFLVSAIFIIRAIIDQPQHIDEVAQLEQEVVMEEPVSQQSFTEVDLVSEVAAKSVKAPEAKKEVSVDDSEICLEISNNTWIQVIYRNDEKSTKSYVAGDNLSLKRDELQGLVIGNVASVKLIAFNKQQDISPFVASGSNVAKIFGEKLRAIGR